MKFLDAGVKKSMEDKWCEGGKEESSRGSVKIAEGGRRVPWGEEGVSEAGRKATRELGRLPKKLSPKALDAKIR